MLHLKDLEATTGYIRGGCSPIGMKKLFPTYLDQIAESYEQIIVSAGKKRATDGVSTSRYLCINERTFADIKQ